ncbi:MAG: Arm DNA-binding domain-containing protein [Brevundimonas sp.]|uniref:Arm DNA-binding domain-containing protein n=1 Tax=Brevundimonas sp. TaxID=1871086 RepID=UPI00391A96D9
MTKLTRASVQQLPIPASGDTLYVDDDLPNFGVRVTSKGVRSYYVRVRISGGRRAQQRRLNLGRIETITPEEARKVARVHLVQARLGEDPGAQREARRAAQTVGQLIDERLEGAGKRNRRGHIRKDCDWANDKGRLENHVKPVLGSIRLPDLPRRDIERMRDLIAQVRTKKTSKTKLRGKPVARGGEGAATAPCAR